MGTVAQQINMIVCRLSGVHIRFDVSVHKVKRKVQDVQWCRRIDNGELDGET